MQKDWDISESYIQRKLAKYQEEPFTEENYLSAFLSDTPKPAAVLVPLLRASTAEESKKGWHILLTRRSDRLHEHRGQVAFPGGRCDPGDDSAEATALREAYEEIGLPLNYAKILGRLNDTWTITNYNITPIVAVIQWPYKIKLAQDEVSRVFTIPLKWLADPSNHEVRQRTMQSPYSLQNQNESHPVIFFHPYNGEILWGVSAEITANLIHVLS